LKLGASHELQTALAEQYENSANPPPGEVYYNYKIRHNRKDELEAARWLVRLSPNQQYEVTLFLKHKSLPAAFDELLIIPGLWFGFRPAMLAEITAMKCDEVS
jgi:hypothetical protein